MIVSANIDYEDVMYLSEEKFNFTALITTKERDK